MTNQRIASYEWGRLIALFAIMAIHVKPFLNTHFIFGPIDNNQPWLGMLIDQLSRFAVPLFFILAGYFIMPRLAASPWNALKRYSKPLLTVWLAWSVIYLLTPFNLEVLLQSGYLAERSGFWNYLLSDPLNTLFTGGFVHLWFVPGLLCAVTIIALLCQYRLEKLIIPIGIVLYCYGLMAGSYQPIFDLESPLFTRNGPFLSVLMVGIGFEARRKNIHLSATVAAVMLLAGMALHLFEAKSLMAYDALFVSHDFLLGTPLWATGLFFLLTARPEFGASAITFSCSKHVLGIYLIHFLVLIYMINFADMLGVNGMLSKVVMWPLCFIISLGLVTCIDKTPLRKVLLR